MKKKILTLLVLLMTAVSGAWAGNITVYFTDAQGYGDVNVYYWPNGADWPGTPMTEVRTNEFGQKIYSAVVPAGVEGIIFNGNGRQTVNIEENIVDEAWWYTNEATDDQGHNTVGYVGSYFIDLTTTDNLTWTLAEMPEYNLELDVEYYPRATLATTPAAAEGLNDATTDDLLTPGTSAEGTLAYALGTSEAPTGQWSQTIPTTEGLEAGEYYVWYKVVGDAEHSDSEPQCIAVTIAAIPTFAVTIDDGYVDTNNWQATPAPAQAGQTVTLTYSGKKKIRSITIEEAPATPATATLADAFVDGNETVIIFEDKLTLKATYNNGFGTVEKSGTMANVVTSATMAKDGDNLVISVTIYGTMNGSMTIDTVNNTYIWSSTTVGSQVTLSAITIGGNNVDPLPTAAK